MIQWVANLCPAQLDYFLVSAGFSPALSALPSVRAAGLGKLQLSSPFRDFSFPSRESGLAHMVPGQGSTTVTGILQDIRRLRLGTAVQPFLCILLAKASHRTSLDLKGGGKRHFLMTGKSD